MKYSEWMILTVEQKRQEAWPFFKSCDALQFMLASDKHTQGKAWQRPVFRLADDSSASGLGAAFSNWAIRKDGFCQCKNTGPETEAYWENPDTGTHGWMCEMCHGITQLG